MRKAIWIAALLLVVGEIAGDAPTTAPAARVPAKPKWVKARDEIRKKINVAAFKPMIERVGRGGINWTRGVVFATGTAKPRSATPLDVAMARRGARLDAARNAILVMNKVRVDAGGKYPQMRSGHISTNAVLKEFKEVSWEHNPDIGRVTVILEAPLCGSSGVVEMLGVKLKPTGPDPWYTPIEDVGATTDVVIVDARGISFAPSLAPRILTPDRKRVFGLEDIPAQQRSVRMGAIYVYMEETGVPRQARSFIHAPIARAKVVSGRAGGIDAKLRSKVRKGFANPIIVLADSTAKDSRGTIVLTPGSVKELAIHGNSRRLMKEGRIVIVTDFGFRR